MKNVFWLIPGRLAGRSGPTYEAWSLREIRDAGFDAVLNLSEFEPSRDEFANAGLDVSWVPIPNTCPADATTEAECVRALPIAYDFVRSHLEANRVVLVHCAWGRDRTGLLLAHHLSYSDGLSPAAAISEVRRVRPKALSAPGWEEMAERVISKVIAGRSRLSNPGGPAVA